MRYATEIKILTLRELAPIRVCDTPDKAVQFFRDHIETAAWFDSEKECLAVLLVNNRCHITGFNLVATGTLDTVQAHPREIFRPAIAAAAKSVILAHNHPSGDPDPSDSDIYFTRDVARAGQLLRIEILDHLIVGQQFADARGYGYTSLRSLGCNIENWGDGYSIERPHPRRQTRRKPSIARA